jgi:hypothetical protein
MYVCMYIRMYACMYARMCIFMHMYMHADLILTRKLWFIQPICVPYQRLQRSRDEAWRLIRVNMFFAKKLTTVLWAAGG